MSRQLKVGQFAKSTSKGKKYMTRVDLGNGKTKIIHFGDLKHEHFKDSTGLGLFSHLNHGDKIRQEKYKKRASKIKDKNGNYTYLDKTKSNYYSYNFLWS